MNMSFPATVWILKKHTPIGWKWKRFKAFLFMAILFSYLPHRSLAKPPEPLTIVGEITMEPGMRTKDSITRFKFQVEIQDCKWFIKAESDSPRRIEYQSAFDGEDIKSVIRENKGTTNEHVGASMLSEPVPYQGPFPIIPAIWTAFCQNCYLDQLKTNLAIQACETRVRNPVSIKLERNASGFPLSIQYINETPTSEDYANVRPPFDHNFTNSVFEATKFNESGAGKGCPMNFEVSVYLPCFQQGGARARNQHFVGSVSRIVSGAKRKSFIPYLPPNRTVSFTDGRFGKLFHPIRYDGTNGFSTAKTPMSLQEFNQWLEKQSMKLKQEN